MRLKNRWVFCSAFLSVGMVFTGCRKTDYDLNKGINTEMTVGGDSLTIPLGSVKPVTLGSVIDGESADILHKSEDGAYSIRLNDSLQMTIDGIKPVSFAIDPGVIEPVETEMAEIEFEPLEFDPVSSTVEIEVPKVDLGKLDHKSISEKIEQSIEREEILGGHTPPDPGQDIAIAFDNVGFEAEETTIPMELTVSLEQEELKQVNTIRFAPDRRTVTVTFDKSRINALTNELTDEIEEFRIVFPEEYTLGSAQGYGKIVDNHVFLIENQSLNKGTSVYEASFEVVSLDLSGAGYAGGELTFNENVTYSLKYTAGGKTMYNKIKDVEEIGFEIAIQAELAIDDVEVELNDIDIEEQSGDETISETVTGLSTDLDRLNTVTFAEGAALKLSVSDPGIAPFAFIAGECMIEFPEFFRFGAYEGMNTETNVLTLSHDRLFEVHELPLLGLDINQTVNEGAITIGGAFSYKLAGLKVGESKTSISKINKLQPKPINIRVEALDMEIADADFRTKSVSFDMVNENVEIDINEFVAEEAERLYSVGLLKPADISLQIKIEGLPEGIDYVHFDNAFLKFPEEFRFREGDANEDNTVVLGEGFNTAETYTKTLRLEGFDFGAAGVELVEGVFAYKNEVVVSGKAHIDGADLRAEEIGKVTVIPTITIDSIHIGEIEGKVAPVIESVDENITLDLPKIFMDENNNLDVNPVITFEVGNTMAVPVDVDLTLTPKRRGNVLTDGVIRTSLTISPAAESGTPTWSRYWLAKTDENASAGYEVLAIPELADLLKTVPDEITVTALPVVTGDRHKVDLSAGESVIDFKYAVNVPLSFGKDFRLQYADTIGGLGESIGDYLELIEQLDVVATVSNEIPLDLQLDLHPIDDQGRPLEGVTLTANGVIGACNIDGTAKTSDFRLQLKETEEGALALLDAFKLEVRAASSETVAGMPLKESQGFSLALKVRIPSGLTIDFGKK